MNKLAKEMMIYRARNQLKQEELGKILNCSRETICKIENGKYEPSRFFMLKWNALLEKEK